MVLRALALIAIVSCLPSRPCAAQGEEAHVAEVRRYVTAQIVPWLREPVLLNAIKSRNLEHQALTDVDIERLDQDWVRQFDAQEKPLIDAVLNNELSLLLRRKMAESQGHIAQIIVMDAKGLNAGMGLMTEDYWQGDEEKWQKGFKVPPGAMFIDKVKKGRSSPDLLTIQVSLPVEDPETGQAIGALAVSIDVEYLASSY